MDRHTIPQNSAKDLENKDYQKDIFFGSKRTLAFAYKKTEKLSSAVYLVTSLVDDQEPLKNVLRSKALKLISDTGALVADDFTHPHFMKEVVKSLYEIISLIDVAKEGGIISEMNISILREEFQKLITFLDKEIHVASDLHRSLISQSLFSVHEDMFQDEKTDDFYKGHSIKDNDFYNTKHGVRNGYGANVANKNPARSIGHSHQDSPFKKQPTAAQSKPTEDRSQKIIAIISDRKESVSIKDIRDILTDVSEKTIQRELLGLVAKGVLKKEGERRWSRYSLARVTP